MAGAAGVAAGVPSSTPTAPSVLVAISPCRAVDTRAGDGELTDGSTTTFQIVGSDGFYEQGGEETGCDIPTDATAITATITVS